MIQKLWKAIETKAAHLWLDFKGVNYKKEQAQTAETKSPLPKVSYARLCAIYEGDMKIEGRELIHVFMLQTQTPAGHEYICPLYVEPSNRDVVRKSFNRCQPIHMLFNEDKEGTVTFKKDVEVKETGNTTPKEIFNARTKETIGR
jgi:hypothetical protein